jgi:hypothetical protein
VSLVKELHCHVPPTVPLSKPKFSEIDIQNEHIKVFLAVPFLSLAGKMFCVWIALELISFDPWCKRNPDQPKMGYEQEMATK